MSVQAQFLNDGQMIDYTPGSDVVAGQVVLVGTMVCVAVRDIASGVLGALRVTGLHKIVKDSSAVTAGDAIYWDADGDPVGGTEGSGAATTTAAGNNLVGGAVAAAAAEATHVLVLQSAFKRTVTVAGSVTADDITGSDASLGIAGLGGAQGGAVVVAGGTSATSGNAGGAVSVTGGVPGATGVGGAATVAGGAGGATSGAGGAASLAGGAGTNGDANGGAASVLGGNADGAGTDGAVNLGTINTSAINIAAASIPTTITGPINRPAGASTAAAGSSYADAGALPAATAGVYPTTAADDAKGVIVDAADKVNGRMIFIGNGVSNKILKVYGPEGATINGAAENVAFSSASGKGVVMYCLSASGNTWLAW